MPKKRSDVRERVYVSVPLGKQRKVTTLATPSLTLPLRKTQEGFGVSPSTKVRFTSRPDPVKEKFSHVAKQAKVETKPVQINLPKLKRSTGSTAKDTELLYKEVYGPNACLPTGKSFTILPTTAELIRDTSFAKPSLLHSVIVEKHFCHVLLPVFKSGFLSPEMVKQVRKADVSFAHLIDWIGRAPSVDTTWLKNYRAD